MDKTYKIDQMKLLCAIMNAIAEQHPSLPADGRTNAVIKAANDICAAYSKTAAEFESEKQ